MQDLTVILLTANKVPQHWADFHLETLKKSAQGNKWMTLGAKPVDFGLNDHEVSSEGLVNIYRKVLRGLELADTDYVAFAEDDTLYPEGHFSVRPKTYGYNLNRWMTFTWGKPFYFYKPMHTNATLIGRRDMLKEMLQERFNRRPNLSPSYCKELGRLRWEEQPETFYTKYPILGLSHKYAIDELEQRENKKAWPVQAFDIPAWRRADRIRKIWNGE